MNSETPEFWDQMYQQGYPYSPGPSWLLQHHIDWLPQGQALDVGTGIGRNAYYLAEHGYQVDGVDFSETALSRAREARSTPAENINWIQADINEFDVASREYDLILVSFFPELEVIRLLKDGLATDGVLLFEHHLRTTDEVDRGPTEDGLGSNPDRYRDRSQELLHTCLGLTILYYEEALRTYEDGGQAAVASVVARNSTGGTQSYPDSRMSPE